MVSGSNDLPELKIQPPVVVPPARRIPTEPAAKASPEAERKLIQAPDTVQLSPRAQAASKVLTVAESAPEVRPARVEEASAKLRAQTPNSSALNAQLAEKLLTEN
jgi:hypothetical protein